MVTCQLLSLKRMHHDITWLVSGGSANLSLKKCFLQCWDVTHWPPLTLLSPEPPTTSRLKIVRWDRQSQAPPCVVSNCLVMGACVPSGCMKWRTHGRVPNLAGSPIVPDKHWGWFGVKRAAHPSDSHRMDVDLTAGEHEETMPCQCQWNWIPAKRKKRKSPHSWFSLKSLLPTFIHFP